MRAIWALAKRELYSFYVSPIAYVVLPIFFLLVTIFYFRDLTAPQADGNEIISQMFDWMFFVSLFMLPMISMRSFSEEYQDGTFELLFTVPVKTIQIVLGKFLGLLSIFLSIALMSTIYIVITFIISNEGFPHPAPVFAQFLGYFLAGLAFLSVGLFISSLTRYQVASVIVTMLICLVLVLMSSFIPRDSSFFQETMERIAFYEHYGPFLQGAIRLEDIYYFIAFPVFFLFLTYVRLDLRKT